MYPGCSSLRISVRPKLGLLQAQKFPYILLPSRPAWILLTINKDDLINDEAYRGTHELLRLLSPPSISDFEVPIEGRQSTSDITSTGAPYRNH